jgi:hypothetical protein
MKDDSALGDDAWKTRACALVDALGPVAAAFDNEPAHVNLYAVAWPDARCVHVDTDHSPREIDVLPGIPSVLDLRRPSATVQAGAGASP